MGKTDILFVVKNWILEMTFLNTVKGAARFSKKKNISSGVRQTWFESTFSNLLSDHRQVTYFEICFLPVRWGKLIQDHFEN